MQTKLIDLIIVMVRMIELGENLRDVKPEVLKSYNKSEISAAYSWVIQKLDEGILNTHNSRNMRILHVAERMMIETDAHGYLLELYNKGILNYHQVENIIELSMMNNFEKVTLEKMKKLVSEQLFGSDKSRNMGGIYLSGNESVN